METIRELKRIAYDKGIDGYVFERDELQTLQELQALEILQHLHAFNKLHARDVCVIADVLEVNAIKLCEDNGITYNT